MDGPGLEMSMLVHSEQNAAVDLSLPSLTATESNSFDRTSLSFMKPERVPLRQMVDNFEHSKRRKQLNRELWARKSAPATNATYFGPHDGIGSTEVAVAPWLQTTPSKKTPNSFNRLAPNSQSRKKSLELPFPQHTQRVTQAKDSRLLTKLDVTDINEEMAPPKMTVFDLTAFDAMIYQQSAASKPPPGVQIPATYPTTTRFVPSRSRRIFVHANPAIHQVHNRSDEWYKEKAQQIKLRGGRKRWFGKVAARRRWMRAERLHEQELASIPGCGRRSFIPQPWSFNRPLNFGHVTESQLPSRLIQDQAWRRASVWFRDVETKRNLEYMELKKAERNALTKFNSISEAERVA
ncbi:hypothetical protein CDD81_2334 [Ophiocordyceps australis]|uniref:Uncharacterized protein n=1 Tax=Ophiocordyceps australis TaxID=1399860 RepID=A0A2C5XRS9_9HYPO|nr:hypothetical protein CDD81_2334 [Ophiocordyceps australis]